MSDNLPAVIDAGSKSEIVSGLARSQAENDRQLVGLWVGRHNSAQTRRNYHRQADRFISFVQCPLSEVRIADLQAYIASLDALASATRANMIAAVKSLLSFGQEIGYLPFNVGKMVKAPPVKNTLAERIMPEADAMRMLLLEAEPRNRALLTLIYGGGLRISEACGLRWRDLAPRDGAGQASIFRQGRPNAGGAPVRGHMGHAGDGPRRGRPG